MGYLVSRHRRHVDHRRRDQQGTSATPADEWRTGRARVRCGLLIAMLALVACTSAPPPAPATPVAITDFRMVAGKWVGTVVGLAGPRNDEGDWLELTIGEDGTYDFGIYRTIGVFGGKGKLMLQDGKLTGEGERGRATYALSERGGRQSLLAEGVLKSGTTVSGTLRRAR